MVRGVFLVDVAKMSVQDIIDLILTNSEKGVEKVNEFQMWIVNSTHVHRTREIKRGSPFNGVKRSHCSVMQNAIRSLKVKNMLL